MWTQSRNWARNGLVMAGLLGGLAPMAVLAMLVFLGLESLEFFRFLNWIDLFETRWNPARGDFGAAALVVHTVSLAILTIVPVLMLGTAAAMRLAYFAGPVERTLCETSLVVMAGLPSVIVGLAAMSLLTPHFGFSLLSASGALFMMIFPVFTVLLTGALRQEAFRYLEPAEALGYAPRQFAWRVALRAAMPSLVLAFTLSLAKAMGEATAISAVIGGHAAHLIPELLGPANTITSAILADHGAATGVDRAALYAIAVLLALLILITLTIGAWVAAMLRRHLA